jgi:nicotinamide riboside transporter PnuC
MREITDTGDALRHTLFQGGCVLFRLDYLSCILTIASTILVGRRCWEGWILATINSVIVCLIGFRTAQFGFIPANLFCIALYGMNLRSWRKPEER